MSWKVELQALRTFFGYFVSRKWIAANPAKEMKTPRHIKPNEVVPYTRREESNVRPESTRAGTLMRPMVPDMGEVVAKWTARRKDVR